MTLHLEGLSPRVRGSLRLPHVVSEILGSIPACAGKPCSKATVRRWQRVYPRVCGEAALPITVTSLAKGLSPRVRGSRHLDDGVSGDDGSIPACAGKPRLPARARGSCGVYPRVCGEAYSSLLTNWRRQGLSPRVRGSRLALPLVTVSVGSIPACAGKPVECIGNDKQPPVYPPRVRGSHSHPRQGGRDLGSIPACAGKPSAARKSRSPSWVYPRVCGEAARSALLI